MEQVLIPDVMTRTKSFWRILRDDFWVRKNRGRIHFEEVTVLGGIPSRVIIDQRRIWRSFQPRPDSGAPSVISSSCFIKDSSRGKAIVDVVIIVKCQCEHFQVVLTLVFPGVFSCLLNRGQDQRNIQQNNQPCHHPRYPASPGDFSYVHGRGSIEIVVACSVVSTPIS